MNFLTLYKIPPTLWRAACPVSSRKQFYLHSHSGKSIFPPANFFLHFPYISGARWYRTRSCHNLGSRHISRSHWDSLAVTIHGITTNHKNHIPLNQNQTYYQFNFPFDESQKCLRPWGKCNGEEVGIGREKGLNLPFGQFYKTYGQVHTLLGLPQEGKWAALTCGIWVDVLTCHRA